MKHFRYLDIRHRAFKTYNFV